MFYEISFRDFLNEDQEDNLQNFIESILSKNINGCGIVYCRNKQTCSKLVQKLIEKKVNAKAYFPGLKKEEIVGVKRDWLQGKIKIIVATLSFANRLKGEDKQNVRLVVHWNLPKSMSAYYQVFILINLIYFENKLDFLF